MRIVRLETGPPKESVRFTSMPRRWLALLIAVVAASCSPDSGSPAVKDAKVVDPAAQRYAGSATVVETRDHGPELCDVSGTAPSSCRGVPVTNWRWEQVKGERSTIGTTWGGYRVVGVYDGGTFTLTERPGPPGPSTLFPDEPLTTPCSPPRDGWRPLDAGRADERAMTAAVAAARQSPGFAGLWIVNAGMVDQVLNVAFTEDLDRRAVEIRQRWGGALCVVRHERTMRELRNIQGEFSAPAGAPLGLRLLGVGVDEPGNQVVIRAVLVDVDARRVIDARYAGAVRVLSALVPVTA